MSTEREAAVRRALDCVTDPELDEPVTDLRFIERLTVDQDGIVSIGFRLPTYWCAANFAFLMADDMRRAVGALPWVRKVRVTLGDHMYADKINHGLEHGLSFQATFGDEASAELDDLRRAFLVKAFQRRQESLLRHLITLGHQPAAIVSMTLPQLQALRIGHEGEPLRQRYLDRREVCAGPDITLAFVDAQCNPLSADTLLAYLQGLGRVSINAEFNGALCRGLLAARFNEDGEPSLYDFARMAPGTAA
ncbi:MAG TPA: iron-sulfur cluster assembly protein [Acetobacteraceae bacterium]|nr:iron-sulfur cluster assembly protein [Acetobacteraceae bacterium]